MAIAADRDMKDYEKFNTPEIKIYLSQLVDLLKIVYLATKDLEGDDSATISKIVPIILNALIELEDPEVLFKNPILL